MEEQSETLLLDVGNSSVHVGLARRELKETFRTGQKNLTVIQRKWNEWSSKGVPGRVLLASVAPEAEQDIRRFLQTTWDVTPLRFREDFPVPIEIRTNTPDEVGDDRLLNAIAVGTRYQSPAVAVDCGTAVTFDVVSEEGAFEGGVIAPGISISAKALHDHTAKLPEVSPGTVTDVFGKDTKTAIKTGIYHGFTGMVRHILDELQEKLPNERLVIGLGGDIHLFDRPEDLFDVIDSNLTLKGLLDAGKHFESGRRAAD